MSISHVETRCAQPRELRHRDALDALHDAAQWVRATLRGWWERSRDRAELAQLDDRMLQDIGLTNAERELLVNKWFWSE